MLFDPVMLITRIARPTNDLRKILNFYHEGLGLDILSEFKDHQGFDGLILGKKKQPFHFEFTVERGVTAPACSSPDNLIVFYYENEPKWLAAIERMGRAGFAWTKSNNPFWDKGGRTFPDADGYRVVLFQGIWNK
jgi:catechol 2,3-dioxygenase-like lactoylglutathione lyase family enzyme